jgi:type I restriction enzyme S subunit
MIGEGRTRGQAAIQDIQAANNQNCAAILVSETPVVPEYVYYWFWARYEITRSAGSGNNQPALNKTKVQNLPLALPPSEEQEEIVREIERRLSILQEVEAQIEADLKRASQLRQSILERAFEGKLVPQDPSDEPASELLERIRREREQASSKKQKRRTWKKATARINPAGHAGTLF